VLVRVAVLALLAALAPVRPATAQEGFGVGIIAGEPTGVTIKSWLDRTEAIDAAAAWSFSGRDSLQLHVDYLVHDFSLVRPRRLPGRLPLYAGLGARLRLRESGKRREDRQAAAGIRVPLGAAYLLADTPVELFLEVVPVLDLAPDTELGLDAAVGARWYFR